MFAMCDQVQQQNSCKN